MLLELNDSILAVTKEQFFKILDLNMQLRVQRPDELHTLQNDAFKAWLYLGNAMVIGD